MISKNIYWVPTKEESEVSLQVPLQNTINSKISNEIEFKQSNELLVPGKTIFCFYTFASFYTVELPFHLVTYFSSRPFNPCACDTTCHKNKSFLGNLKDKKIWWNKNFLRALCLSVLGRAQKNARCYFFITFQNYPHPLLKQKWSASVFPTITF